MTRAAPTLHALKKERRHRRAQMPAATERHTDRQTGRAKTCPAAPFLRRCHWMNRRKEAAVL